jgi:hypothetical protein
MTDMYGPSSTLAARRRTALAASLQLDRDQANPALLRLGRDLAKACLKRAAEIGDPDLKISKAVIAPPPPQPPKSPSKVNHRDRSIVADVKRQTERDWWLKPEEEREQPRPPVLAVELERRRFVARQLVIEGLRLLAPDERRGFFDLAVRWLEYFDRKDEPAA